MAEQFANGALTTLASAASDTDTSLQVTSASGFPSSGSFRIRIDDEILTVTAVAGTTWTVIRASESLAGVQVAAAHALASEVRLVWTAGAAEMMAQRTELESRLPAGVIVMWAGTIASIPVGWFLCDGNNGTPDLRDRFIVGEGTTPGGTGGTISPASALATHATHSAHADHPAHAHRLPFGDNGTANMGWTTGGFGHSGSLSITGIVTFAAAGGAVSAMLSEGAAAMSHSAHSAHDAHGVYKYYKMAFIMKA